MTLCFITTDKAPWTVYRHTIVLEGDLGKIKGLKVLCFPISLSIKIRSILFQGLYWYGTWVRLENSNVKNANCFSGFLLPRIPGEFYPHHLFTVCPVSFCPEGCGFFSCYYVSKGHGKMRSSHILLVRFQWLHLMTVLKYIYLAQDTFINPNYPLVTHNFCLTLNFVARKFWVWQMYSLQKSFSEMKISLLTFSKLRKQSNYFTVMLLLTTKPLFNTW